VRRAVDAIQNNLPEHFDDAARDAQLVGAMRELFLAIRRNGSASPSFSQEIVGWWILAVEAAPEAIVSCIHEHDPENGEFEYLVDRRRLGRVCVVERFPRSN
jgi:hypothetical protein